MRIGTTLALLGAAGLSTAASAVVLDFEGVSSPAPQTALVLDNYSFTATSVTGPSGGEPGAINGVGDVLIQDVNGDSRLRAGAFQDELTLTTVDGSLLDLNSFALSNFTFNDSHEHLITIRYNFATGPATDITFQVGQAVPGNRAAEFAFNVPQTGLTSVEFLNGTTFGPDPGSEARLFFLDSVDVTPSATDPIPEPASIGLVGLGALTLLRRNRKG